MKTLLGTLSLTTALTLPGLALARPVTLTATEGARTPVTGRRYVSSFAYDM